MAAILSPSQCVNGLQSMFPASRDTPSVSLQQSPRPVAPSQSLELSDSEIEFNMKVNISQKQLDYNQHVQA